MSKLLMSAWPLFGPELPRAERWRDLQGMHFAVGPQLGADGSTPATGRQCKTGEAAVAQVHGKYHEAASRGFLFGAQEQGSGVAPGTALGTTACLSLFNPRGSGKLLSVKKVSLGYVSGTLGAGTVYHCGNLPADTAALGAVAAPSGGTALVVYPRRFGFQPQQASAVPVGLARVGGTVTTPVALRAFCGLGASLASTAVAPWIATEDIDGEFVIEPGFCYQLQAIAAGGSSPLVSPGVVWEELPIL